MSGNRDEKMDEIERDGAITINVGFGNITFAKDERGPFAVAMVDVAIETAAGADDRIEMSVRVPSEPDRDTILVVVERCRAHLVGTLRSAATHLDDRTAEDLLFAPSKAGTSDG